MMKTESDRLTTTENSVSELITKQEEQFSMQNAQFKLELELLNPKMPVFSESRLSTA